MAAATILAGDIGGTKTLLALYRVDGSTLTPIHQNDYSTRAYPSLEVVLSEFMHGGEKAAAACFGVPGPVIDGVSHAPNVPWEMRERAIADAIGGVPVRLINDLEATAHGVPHLTQAELAVLQTGTARGARDTICVIAAGTGLGESALVAAGGGWHAIATEGGHCDFAPRGREQVELLEFLAREFGHVSVERLLSGPGLHNIFRFLAARAPDSVPQWLSERMALEDPAAVIGEVALNGGDPLCVNALEIFCAIYGAEAGNLALKFLALGGVYLCGGIAPKILPFLKHRIFLDAFLDKGRMRPLLETLAVRVSLNQATGLIGAAHVAMSML